MNYPLILIQCRRILDALQRNSIVRSHHHHDQIDSYNKIQSSPSLKSPFKNIQSDQQFLSSIQSNPNCCPFDHIIHPKINAKRPAPAPQTSSPSLQLPPNPMICKIPPSSYRSSTPPPFEPKSFHSNSLSLHSPQSQEDDEIISTPPSPPPIGIFSTSTKLFQRDGWNNNSDHHCINNISLLLSDDDEEGDSTYWNHQSCCDCEVSTNFSDGIYENLEHRRSPFSKFNENRLGDMSK